MPATLVINDEEEIFAPHKKILIGWSIKAVYSLTSRTYTVLHASTKSRHQKRSFPQVSSKRPFLQHGRVCCGLELSTRLSHEPSQKVCRLVNRWHSVRRCTLVVNPLSNAGPSFSFDHIIFAEATICIYCIHDSLASEIFKMYSM
jgi:hypothetical protein